MFTREPRHRGQCRWAGLNISSWGYICGARWLKEYVSVTASHKQIILKLQISLVATLNGHAYWTKFFNGWRGHNYLKSSSLLSVWVVFGGLSPGEFSGCWFYLWEGGLHFRVIRLENLFEFFILEGDLHDCYLNFHQLLEQFYAFKPKHLEKCIFQGKKKKVI